MQLKFTDLVAVKSTGLLPVFGYALAAALVIGLAVGCYAGWKWHAGSTAIAENAQLRLDAKAWTDIANQQRQINTDNATAFQAALDRLGSISQERENDREELRQFQATQRTELQQIFDRIAGLRAIDAGPDLLRHWNKANAGPAATPAAAEPAGKPAPAMPGASTGTQQPVVRPERKPRRSDGAVSRLPQQQRAADRGQRRMANHRLAVVLHRSEAHRHRRGRMPA